MHIVLMAAATDLVLLGLAFACVFARLLSWYRIVSPRDDPSAVPFSVARYREVERLLNEGEAQQSVIWRSKLKFRELRSRIVRDYLRELFDDFNRVCRAIRRTATSQVDRSDLEGLMMNQHFLFALGMMSMEVKLILYRFGWRSVELAALMRSVETMRFRLESFAAIAQARAASRGTVPAALQG